MVQGMTFVLGVFVGIAGLLLVQSYVLYRALVWWYQGGSTPKPQIHVLQFGDRAVPTTEDGEIKH